MAVAYSGGRDSTALLHACLAGAPAGVDLVALHVHHGLSAHADAWLAHCQKQCDEWRREGAALHFVYARIDSPPPRGESVEAWARRERYRLLTLLARQQGVDVVLLAHHRRDQAETFLLQALRGAGTAGLAGMPRAVMRDGIAWVRPWLEQSHESIEDYVRAFGLRHIDDHSNAEDRYARSRLRTQVWPALSRAFPDSEQALAHSAAWAQEASACLAEVADEDLNVVIDDAGAFRIAAWRSLSSARRGNVLRRWLQRQLGSPAPANLVRRLLDELQPERAARWPIDDRMLFSQRGVLRLEAASAPITVEVTREACLAIEGPGLYPLPGWGGSLQVCRRGPSTERGSMLARATLREVTLRIPASRVQFQAGPGRPPRSLKKQYQAVGVPAWRRVGPLLFSGGQLVFVPGLGVDARVCVDPRRADAVHLRWLPMAASLQSAGGEQAGRIEPAS